MRPWTVVLAVFSVSLLAGPSTLPAAKGETSWVFDLSGKGGFFDLPFPTELRRTEGGGIKVDDFPDPLGLAMVRRLKRDFYEGYGFSTAPVVYFRFTRDINPDTLPGPKEVMAGDDPLFLVDVDPDSEELGRRFPVMARFYPRSPPWLVRSGNLLAIMPVPGFVLREDTLYAAGVMRSLGDRHGAPLARSAALAELASGRAPQGELGAKALEVYGPVLLELSSQGVATGDLSALTVFRTGDPAARMMRLFDGAVQKPVELDTPLEKTREYEGFCVLQGAFMMPQFQQGENPFLGKEGRGDIAFDEDGKPVVQWFDRTPFCLTVPKAKMPEQGFPILIYIHGTSGLSTQVVDRGVVTEQGEGPPPGTGPAMVLARRAIAAAGAAQLRNRERGGTASKTTYHNVLNPRAYRDNVLQSAIEQALFLRFLQGVEIEPEKCPDTDSNGQKIRFDPGMIFGMGQSMGSETLGPWAGVETELKAVIHSGHGPFKALQIAEGNQFNLKYLKKRGLGTGEGLLGLDRYHPLLNMLAAVMAPADSFAFEPHYYKRPLPGRPAKHLWVSFGTDDHYFPPSTQNASVLSMGLDLIGPARVPGTLEMIELAGLRRLEYPVSLNRSSPKGPVTAVTVQYEKMPPKDGHHINFQRHETRFQYSCFLSTLAETGAPVLFAPAERWDAECSQRAE